MAQHQSYSSLPPYTVSPPTLYYNDSSLNPTHEQSQRQSNYATSYEPIQSQPQPPTHGSPSAYLASDDTYQADTYEQPWISYSITEHTSQQLYRTQSQSPSVVLGVVQRIKPCVIPQITKVFGGSNMSPFARVRARDLELQTGLIQGDLLGFIEGLNEAFLANPALQATNKIGMLVGFVPLAVAQIVGGGLQVAAGLGSAGVSAVRTKQYLKKANEVIFKPKGLLVRVVKTDKMLALVGVRDPKIFSGEQYRVLVGRDGSESQSPLATTMAALGDQVMPLSFDTFASSVDEENWMKKWGAYSAQRAERKQLEKLQKQERRSNKSKREEKKDKKSRREERKVENAIAELQDDVDDIKCRMQSLDQKQQSQAKTKRDLERELRKLEKKLADLKENREYDLSQNSDEGAKRQARRDVKEVKKVNKLRWIVIMSANASMGDEEHDLDSDDEEMHCVL